MPYRIELFKGQGLITRSNAGADLSSAMSQALNFMSIYGGDRVVVVDDQTDKIVFAHPVEHTEPGES